MLFVYNEWFCYRKLHTFVFSHIIIFLSEGVLSPNVNVIALGHFSNHEMEYHESHRIHDIVCCIPQEVKLK